MTQSSSSENVKVTVRSRPLKSNEQSNNWKIVQGSPTIMTTRGSGSGALKSSNNFSFDHIFNGSDNEALYNTSIKHLILQAMEGYNATVFAYGQTASGKTFTMMGNEDEPGVIPRSVNDIFEHIKESTDREFLLRVSYLEIYNESIRDLLNPSNKNLKIHEDKKRGVYVSSLTEAVVTCIDEVFDVIDKGESSRHISSTDYNLHSSRSHTIFQIIIESREKTGSCNDLNKRTLTSSGYGNSSGGSNGSVKISQLNLIDLAGSEKAVSNESRRKEGAYINKSLLTLGTVISKLTESAKGGSHIPFRDSKLTRILQTALTGLAKVAVICTISPSIKSIDESLNTLKFASRVKKIAIHAKNDDVMDDKALLHKYRGEIMELKSKLQSTTDDLVKQNEQTESILTAERREHEQQLKQMRNVRVALKERIDHLTKLILTSSTVTTTTTTSHHEGEEKNKHIHQDDKTNSVHPTTTDATPVNDMMVEKLKRQLEEMREVSKAKDLMIDSLQRQMEEKDFVISKLEAEMSIRKAELQLVYDEKRAQVEKSLLYPYQDGPHVTKLIHF